MNRSMHSRSLAFVLALVMVFSMLPVFALAAEESATWTKVDAADITAADTIMVTMTNANDVTYALYTVQSGGYGPEAKVVTVNGDTVTTEGTADYGWTVTPVDGGYTLSVDGEYLYTINNNNGVRIGDTAAVWTIDGTYLSTSDTGGNARWLGVYDNNNGDYTAVATPNWRAYKNTTGNTKNQTLGFWKLAETETEPEQPEDPYKDIDKTLSVYEKVTAPAAGDTVIMVNETNAKILSSTASGYKLADVSATLFDGYIAIDADAIEWVVGESDGVYTFTQDEMMLGMVLSGSYVNLSTKASDGYTDWSLTAAADTEGTFYLQNTKMPAGSYGPYYLEWYSGFTAYASSSPTEAAFGMTFYKLVREGVEEEVTPSEPEEEPEVSTLPFKDGDQVVIYAPAYGKALSANKASYYNAGVDVTITDGTMSGYGETEIWTVTVNEDGTVSFANGGQNIGLAASYSSMDLGAVNDDWTLEDLGDGLYNVKNAVRGNYMEWYNSYSNWSTYASSSAATDDQFQIAFYVIPSEEEEEPAGPLSTGDQVVIYVPAYNKALSANKASYYNAGVDVTITDGTMSGYGETEIWTVTVNEDGSYSFANGGQNIGLAASYSSMDLGAVNDDWTLEDLGGGLYNVKNVVRGNYMEWYNSYSNWSTYASSSAATDDQFQIAFYVISGEEEEPDEPVVPDEPENLVGTKITSLDQLVSGQYVLVVESGYAPTVLDNGWVLTEEVTIEGNKVVSPAENLIWTLTVEDGQVTLTDPNGVSIAPKGGNNNGISSGDYKWAVTCTDGVFRFAGQGDDTVLLASNTTAGNGDNKFRGYKTTTVSGYPNTYLCDFTLYQVGEARESGLITDLSKLQDGDTVVVFNPANMMALSTNYTGFYNLGTAVTISDGKLSGYTDADIWTIGINDDGTYTFSTADGKKLSMGTNYTSTPLDDVNVNWEISAAATADCVYIKNSARGAYLEWYADKGNWSSYYSIGSNEALFAQQIYLVLDDAGSSEGGLPTAGDEVVLYNLSAKGVLAAENDTESIENALTEIVDGKAVPSNGGVIFKVEVNGNYYRFYNETYGYLCSNGTGNNAFYSLEASNDADWTLTAGKSGGYNLESRTAKYNGIYSQYLEYYADSYKTYSMYNVTDYDIYEFVFYPVAEGVNVTGGIVNNPGIDFGILYDAYVGTAYTFTFTVDAVFGVGGELTVKAGDAVLTANANGSYTIPVESVVGESITITVTGVDTKGVAISGEATVNVLDEPVIGTVSPAANSETGEDKKPVISAEIFNAGEDAAVTMTVNGETVEAVYADGMVTYTPAEDMADGRTTVVLTVTRADGKTASKTWSFTVGEAQFQLYFGQLHSHTTYSDGSGTLESALSYVASLPESANVDFVAFTDHSNYFDTTSAANPEGALYDMSLASTYSQDRWKEYKDAVAEFNASQSEIVAIAGFEMTWSGGPGHINTFDTAGIVSRNNSTLNNKTSDAGMKAYYALLSQAEGVDSISQFNHPGSTFGTFSDFSYWDALIDSRIYLVEVGNGEGQIGAGGYYPSYEYYTMALDKGWHVAPTNNQDNHKGKWGNANDARDVILTDDFSEEGIYEAIRALRVYATEDKNLEIGYTVNGLQLGSIIEEVPESLNFEITVYDPDASDSISKVELIVNSGKVAYTWSDPADLADGALSVTLDPTYSYYYVRVTEGDGDLAVTAPVWVGESLKLGISSVESSTSTPVTDEELTITTTLFNSESAGATIKSMVYTIGDQVIGTVTPENADIPASGSATVDFTYTPTSAKVTTITVTAIVEQDGVEYTFSMDIQLDVQDASKLVYIGIDASHYNEYVSGNYKDSMGNFGELAAEYSVRTVQLNTSEELIAACSNEKYVALILTAPSRRLAAAQAELLTYTDAELEAIKAFNDNGGTVILAGWSDAYEAADKVGSIENFTADKHMAATQNAVLEALGSSLRIADDATYDDVRSAADGVDKWRLYFNTYGDSFLVDGVEVDAENPYDRMYTEVFSHYGGASVYTADGTIPSTVTPVVFGHSSTYSVDVDGDGLGGNTPKYTYAEGDDRLMVMATEQLDGKGLIVVSGAAFMSNFEVQATIEDSGSEKNYSNYKICENLLAYLNPVTVTDIAEVNAQTETGVKYTIEGVVTSNASGYDKDTAFFDCIYVQDETGGICCFPVAGNYKIGDKVRITGTTDYYQGEPELQVTSIEVIGEGTVEPTVVTAAQINDRSVEGKLVTISGTVESFEMANGLVQTIMVKDAEGNVARIFIDGYITTSADVADLAVGNNITATGLASYDDTFNAPEGPFPRIRIRNRADVICSAPEHDCTTDGHKWDGGTVTTEAACTTDGVKTYTCGVCGETKTESISALGHTWDEGKVTTEATCGKEGVKTYTCAACGETKTESIKVLDHTWDAGKVTTEATCTKDGVKTYTCSACGETKTEAITKLGHNYKDGVCTRCNADEDSAETGDVFITIWISTLVLSAAAILFLLVINKKRACRK